VSDPFWTFVIVVGFVHMLIGIDNWLFPVPEYVVTSTHPEHGCEVRHYGDYIKVHVTDETLFKAHIERQRKIVMDDINRKQEQ
jgi:hypothetical protein